MAGDEPQQIGSQLLCFSRERCSSPPVHGHSGSPAVLSSARPEELAWGRAERQGRQAHAGVVMFGVALPHSGNLEYRRAILSEACGATRARNGCLLMK